MSKFKLNREILEYRRHRTVVWSITVTKIFKYLTAATATIIPFWFAFLSIESLAGLDTDAEPRRGAERGTAGALGAPGSRRRPAMPERSGGSSGTADFEHSTGVCPG